MNKKWGYKVDDTVYKSTETLIRYLVSTSGKGANLLLNIGPQPNGELPAKALIRLKEMGEWLRKYGEAIYGTTAGDVAPQEWGATTRKGDKLYVHITNLNAAELRLPLACEVVKACAYDDKSEVRFSRENGAVVLHLDKAPTEIDYIVELTTK